IVEDRTRLEELDGLVLTEEPWGFSDDRIDIVFNCEDSEENDHTHYRRSGMTQVHAKRAVENDVTVAFNLQLLFTDHKAKYMGRMMQNVRICQKYDVPMRLISLAEHPKDMRHPKDVEALGRVLGMTDEEARDAVEWNF
ncbi:MAG: RNase P subunit p30 family protein, partial [Halobacteriaceae archaeon]